MSKLKNNKFIIALDIIVVLVFGLYLVLNIAYRNNNLSEEDNINIEPLIAGDSNSGSSCRPATGTITAVGLQGSGAGISKSESYTVNIVVAKVNSSCNAVQTTSGITCSWTISGSASSSGTGFSIPIPSNSGSGCTPATFNISATCSSSKNSVTQTGVVKRYPGDWGAWAGTSTSWTFLPSANPNMSSHGFSCNEYNSCTILASGYKKCGPRRTRCSCPDPVVEADPTVTTYHYIDGTTNTAPGCSTSSQSYTKGSNWTTSACSPTDGYNYVSRSSNWEGTNIQGDQNVYYYYKQNYTVTVHHYRVNTTTNPPGCSDPAVQEIAPGGNWSTSACSPTSGWVYSSVSGATSGPNISSNITVIYYYEPTYTITTKHVLCSDGTTAVHANDVQSGKKAGASYSTSAYGTASLTGNYKNNYEWNGVTPSNASGTVSGDTTVTYCYQKRSATLRVHHYLVGSTTKVHADDTSTVYYTDSYSTSYYGTGSLNNDYKNIYEWNKSTPSNASGTVSTSTVNQSTGEIVVTYYYRKTTVITHHYLVGTTTPVHADDSVVKFYGNTYSTTYYGTGSLNSGYTNIYEWNKVTPANSSGTVADNVITGGAGTSSQVIEKIYYYRKTTVLVHHYEIKNDGTTTTNQVHADDSTVKFYGDSYSTSAYPTGSLISPYTNKYEWNYVPVSNASGTVADNVITSGGGTDSQLIEKIYYYILRPAKLTVRHFIKGTTSQLCDTVVTNFNGTGPRLDDPYTATACDLAANNRPFYTFDSVEITAGSGAINGQTVTGTHTIPSADGGTIITYYYDLKRTTLTVQHFAIKRNASGVLTKSTDKVHDDDITQNIAYGTAYSKNGLNSSYLYENPPYKDRYVYNPTQDELVNVSSKTGLIITDNPTIKFYYAPKPSTVRVRYYKKDTTTRVPGVTQDYDYVDNVYYDDTIDITQAVHKYGPTTTNSNVNISFNYKLDSVTVSGLKNNATNNDQVTGTVNADEVIITYYYVRKTATLNVNHYIIGTNGVKTINTVPNAHSTTETIYVGESYTVTESPDVISTYTFHSSDGDPVHVDTIVEGRTYTVNMYYKIREASVTSRYLICELDRQIGSNAPVTSQVPYETTYNGVRKTIAGYRYKGVRNTLFPNDPDKGDPETGTVTKGEYRIDYCYAKLYTLKIKHVDLDTGTVLLTENDRTLEEGESFTTNRITRDRYNFINVSGPSEGRAQESIADQDGVIQVTYYYQQVFTLTLKYQRRSDRETLADTEVRENLSYGNGYAEYHIEIEGYEPDGIEGTNIGTMTSDRTVVFLYKPTMYDVVEKYVDCDSRAVLHQEQLSQKAYLSTAHYEKINIPNYNYVNIETDAEEKTINQAAGTIDVKIQVPMTTITYCYRLREARLVVNHLEEGTNAVLSPQEVTDGLKWGNQYQTNKKTIENYSKVRDSGNTNGTIASDLITVTYWYQKNSGSLTIRYLECSSERVLHAPKEVPMNEGDPYDTRPDKLNIQYYQYDRVQGDEVGTIRGDVVVTYCYKRLSGHLTVKYKDDATDEVIAEETSLDWTLGEEYSSIPYIKTINNYTSPPSRVSGVETGTMGNPSSDVEVTYYYTKAAVQLIVKYVDMDVLENGSPKEFANSRVTENKAYGDRYTTTQKEFQYYHFVRVDKPESGYIYNQLIITYYYRRDKGIVRTYYRDIETQEEIATREEEEKWYEEHYDTVQKVIPKYTFERVDGVTSGNLLSDVVEVTYYYKKDRGTVTVRHINRDTGERFVDDVTTTYKLDERYETSSREFENFELVATPDNYVGIVTSTEPIIVTYYYAQLKGVVITRYKDEDTKEELLPTVRQGYNYGDVYTTQERTVENYHLTRIAGITTGVVGDDVIEVTYFYRKNIGSLTVEHIDQVSGRNLVEPNYTEYYYGTSYSTHREIFENYEFVRVQGAETGTILGDVVVKYYYRTKDALLTVNYLEEGTGRVLKTREVFNVKWGEEYRVNPVTIENFEYTRSDGDLESGIINGDKVINYYYRRKEANLVVHHLERGTDRILANEDREVVYYGLPYSTSSKEIEGYKVDGTPENAYGIVEGNIEVTYYYDRKDAEVITMFLEKGTNRVLSEEERLGYNFGDTYVTYSREIPNYELVDHEGDLTGKVTKEKTYVTYFYSKRIGTVTIKYLDESDLHYLDTGDIPNPGVSEVPYGDPYTSEELVFDDYELTRIEGNPSGEVNGDVIVIYYYKKREGKVIAKYLELGTNMELHSETVTSHKYGEGYQTVRQNIKDYNYVMVDGDEIGTVRAPITTVIYYYQKKEARIIARYLEEGTNREIASPQEQTLAYGKYYTTSSSGEVPENYELVRKTDNFEGIVKQDVIEVYYYYRKKDSTLTTNVSKIGTDEITSTDDIVDYEINYQATISDYIGPVKVTIVDKLPYKIDKELSDLGGGTYNEYKNTIEWIEEIEDFSSYDSEELLITKYISLKYKDIDPTERTMVNTITGKIKLSNNSQEKEDNFITRISIPGTIIVHHYLVGTTEELVPDEINEGLVGETYISHEQTLEGYKVVTKPSNETHTFREGEFEVLYEYERIKFHIDVEVVGGVGDITGEEDVYYGDDSTPDNIVITPGEGYEITRIMVNGTEYEITDPEGMILDNFKNVQEDIKVQVEFTEKPLPVPITGANTSKVLIIVSILVIFAIMYVAFQTGFVSVILKR